MPKQARLAHLVKAEYGGNAVNRTTLQSITAYKQMLTQRQ